MISSKFEFQKMNKRGFQGNKSSEIAHLLHHLDLIIEEIIMVDQMKHLNQ